MKNLARVTQTEQCSEQQTDKKNCCQRVIDYSFYRWFLFWFPNLGEYRVMLNELYHWNA
jgi:hypothetical protein